VSRAFTLATVLRVRGIQEEVARGHLAAAVGRRSAAAEAVQAAVRAYEDAPAEPAADGRRFLADRARRTALAAGVASADGAHVEAGTRVDGARAEWSAAAMRLSALERLAERAREAQRLRDLAADQRTAEETSAAVLAGKAAR
jgi:flagellar protein FliJ